MPLRGPRPRWFQVLNRVVIVSALGYFVDIYDLILFSIVRVPSLQALGVTDPDELLDVGTYLLNWQMGGMLVGGLAWGILGDKRGRRSILFGSIALYSLCNLANAFVTNIPTYAALRFFAGVGLAGELGAAITLVSEVLPAQLRGYGTTIVSAVGILGAVAGYYVARLFDWQTAYIVGGLMGLVLLTARIAISESTLFRALESHSVARGDLRLLLATPERAGRFVLSILIGIPTWCVIGILVTFSPEIALDLRIAGPVSAATAVLWCYAGASLGSLASGTLSQVLASRRHAVIAFLTLVAAANFAYFFARGIPPGAFYALCGLLGLGAGYWAVFAQIAAEQFGTNLRATVATSVPNFVRGSVVPLTLLYKHVFLQWFDRAESAMLLLSLTLLLALWAVRRLPETYGRDLDFAEGGAAPRPGPGTQATAS